MLKVSIALIAGLVSQLLTNSYLVSVLVYDLGYELYILTVAATYLSFALCCVKLAVTEVNNNKNYSATLISVLCLCMLITASFNIAMINSSMYYLLNDYKSGDGISWKNIYLAIELSILTMVIANGIFVVLNFCLHYFCLGNRVNNINQSNIKGQQE